MKHIIRLGVLGGAMALSIVGNSIPVKAVGNEIKQVVIAEVSPEAKDSASKEYVGLYNPNTFAVSVGGWRLQYRSAAHTQTDAAGWSIKSILGCQSTKASDCPSPTQTTIGAGETLRLSSFETGEGVMPLASGMATTGGQLQLIQPGDGGQSDLVQDMVGYGSAAAHEGALAAPAPKAGRSIVRKQDEHGAYADTDNNGEDFILSPDEDADQTPQDTSGNTDNGNSGGPQPGQGGGSVNYVDAEITEVMPDPASPQLDSADEFIELYNPYGQPLDLTGYVIKTGTDWSHKYTIAGVTIDPFSYTAFMSAQTHLSLSNSGSGVRLYDPAGNLLYEVPSYGKAKTGDSWVKDTSGQWVWTNKPTPGEQNLIEKPVEATTAAKTTSSSTKKSTAAKTSSSAKKASAPKTGAVKGASTVASQPVANGPTGDTVGLWVLAGAGVLGAGYGLYEYRQEIGGFVRRRWQMFASMGRR